jgi:hypothetical protein
MNLTDDNELPMKILRHLDNWRRIYRRRYDGTILVSVADARFWDEEQQRQASGYGRWHKSTIQVGHVGTIWGVPCRVEKLDPGTALLEMR